MGAIKTLTYIIMGEDKLTPVLKKTGAEAEKQGNTMGASFAKAGKMAAVAGVAIAVGLGVAIKEAGDYQESLDKLVTGAGESEKNMGLVSNSIQQIAIDTGTTLSQLTSGAFMIESAGYHGAAGMTILKAAAEGAKTSGADLGTVANALTTVMTDYHFQATDAAKAQSGLNAIVSSGKTNLQDLSSSMARALPTASALHISFSSVGGAMATMTGEGISAKLAAMGLNAAMLALAAPSTTAIKQMQALGISSKQVGTDLTTKGILPAIKDITDAASKKFPQGSADWVAAVNKMVGGSRGLQVALALTGTHLTTTQKNTAAVALAMRDAGSNVSGWETAQKSFNIKLDQFKEIAQVAAVNLGTKLIPELSTLMVNIFPILNMGMTLFSTGLTTIAKAFSDLPTPLKIAVGGIIALGVALSLASANPVIAIIGGIILLVGACVKYWPQISGFFKNIATVLAGVAIIVLGLLRDMVNGVLTFVGTVLHGIATAFGWVPGLGGKLKGASKAFDSFKAGVNNDFAGMIASVRGWQDAQSGANDRSKAITASMVSQYNSQLVASSNAKRYLDAYTTAIRTNGANSDAAKAARDRLTQNLISAGVNSATTKRDVDNYTNAVRLNGANSDAARAARQRLNNDISGASRNAQDAKNKVDGLTDSIKRLPKSTQIAIKEVVSGGGSITVQGDVAVNKSTGIAVSLKTGEKTFNGYSYAGGGQVGGRGTATSDSNPARVSRGEWIINARSAGQYGSAAMASVNNGSAVIGYANGGPVQLNDSLIPSTATLSEQVMGSATAGFVSGAKSYFSNLFQQMMSGPPGGATGSEMQNGIELYNYLLTNLFGGSKIAAAGAAASIWGESSWNPFAQGTGGRGLIAWTPPGTISDANFSGGMRTQLPMIIQFVNTSGDWGAISQMKGASSILEAANIWGMQVERYGINDVHSTGLALAAQIMGAVAAAPKAGVSTSPVTGEQTFNGYSYALGGPVAFDSGFGILKPGYSLAYNGLGHDESLQSTGGRGGNTYQINITPTPLAQPRDIGREVVGAIREFEKGAGKGWRNN
jgi:TP901 family phage tail tape measure protein